MPAGASITVQAIDGIAGAVAMEQKEKRPTCAWLMPQTRKLCGSDEHLFSTQGNDAETGYPFEAPVCSKHLLEAWRTWGIDSAAPL
jgi:hypothetical protein